MFVAIVFDMDDIEPYCTLGPYDSFDRAVEDGNAMAAFLSDETLIGHAHPHEWDSYVEPVVTYNEVLIRMGRHNA